MASVKALNTISNFAKAQFDRTPVVTDAQLAGADNAKKIA
jgi:hypothetical protein